MSAAGRALVAAALLVAGTAAAGAARGEDPQALMDQAASCLARGDVAGAESATGKARSLIEADPLWDPGGRIAAVLIPALESRIGRLRAALRDVKALASRAQRRMEAARQVVDPGELAAWFQAERESAEKSAGELERIASSLPSGPDRGALLQSGAWRRELDAIAARVVPEMAGQLAGPDENERVSALLGRLASLKRDVVTLSMERETLQGELAAVKRARRDEQARLLAFIGQRAGGVEAAEASGLSELGTALAHRVRDRLEVVRSLKAQTMMEKVLSIEELERFRLVNAISVAEGSRDLGGRLDALAEAIDNVPLEESVAVEPSMGWLACCLSMCRR